MDSSFKAINVLSREFKTYPRMTDELIQKLRSGEYLDESEFDRLFPPFYHIQSTIHWSPIEVARQIASWLASMGTLKFIDIGCGVGKLCILLQILTRCEISGIEQRTKLVAIADEIIRANSLRNIKIHKLNMLDLCWNDYDVYYLFNPFEEHKNLGESCVLDRDIELNQKYFTLYTGEVLKQLNAAKIGKILITFHGYGGKVPAGWTLLESRRIDNGTLAMWMKVKL